MRSRKIKLGLSALIAVLVVAALPVIGVTVSESDSTNGMMIDFGYWDVVWIEMMFPEGSNGMDALDAACHIKGYDYTLMEDGRVFSINGQNNLPDMVWKMYVLSGSSWAETDPSGADLSEHRIVCWARSSGPEGVMPGSDYTGHTYYGYAKNGISTVTGNPLKVISLAPSITETLCEVGGLDYIIGSDLYSNYPEEYVEKRESGEISIIGGYTDPNYEWIVKLAPDLVFCDGGTGEHVAIADKLRKSGISCVVLYDVTDIDKLYNNLWIAATAIGFSENANDSINTIRKTIDTVAGIAGNTGRRVFVSLSTDPSPWTSGSGTFMNSIISQEGGFNVFSTQSSSWFMVSKEQIFAKQPDVMIIIGEGRVIDTEGYLSMLDSMDPVWKETPAFRNGDVYVFSGHAADILSRPGPRLCEAAEFIAKILNPDAFIQKDPMDGMPKYLADDYKDYLKYQEGSA